MEQTLNPAQTTQILIAKKMMVLENQVKSGINSFFWIAGLSLVNTIIFLSGGSTTFIMGLGITQVIDGVIKGLGNGVSSNTGIVLSFIGFLLDLGVAGLFVLVGVLGRKRFGNAVIFGIVLYIMDGLIFLSVGEWLPFIFHGLILLGLWKGYRALGQIKKIEESHSTGDLAVFKNSLVNTDQLS